MSKFFAGVVSTTFVAVIGLMGATSAPAVASPRCMTQDEARKAFPRDHLYWHTLQHCWDNVGQKRNTTPAAKNADAAYAEATPPEAKPTAPAVDKPTDAAVDEPAKPVVMSPVPFTGGESRGGIFSLVPDAPANGVQARTQEADALPSAPPEEQPASAQPEENVVIGAPNAAPGSPEYLLEHCCWPKQVPAATAQSEPVGHLAIAAGGASGLALGLWLFFKQRRRSARRRMAARFNVRDSAMIAADVIATAAESAIATAAARVTAVAASLLRSWSALRDRRAY